MGFTLRPTSIPEVLVITPQVHRDARGFFFEGYKESDFRDLGITESFVQANRSRSAHKTIRGLHYQIAPMAQNKLVSVVAGTALDVIVDLRRGSPWFGHHVALELDEAGHEMLWVPSGFAHGFCALQEPTDLQYLVSCEYSPEHERGIHAFDPGLGIQWPFPPEEMVVSSRDALLPNLADADDLFTYDR